MHTFLKILYTFEKSPNHDYLGPSRLNTIKTLLLRIQGNHLIIYKFLQNKDQ